MKAKIFILLLLAFAFTFGCARFVAKPPVDNSPQIVDGVAVTGSPSWQLKSRVTKTDEGVTVHYAILFENVSSADVPIGVSGAVVDVNGEKDTALCSSSGKPGGGAGDAKLAPAKQWLVRCDVKLKATATNRLAQKDTEAQLEIPVGENGKLAIFSYQLRIEDFQ